MSILKQASMAVLGSVLAVLGTGVAAKAIVTTGDPANYLVAPGDYSGVALLGFFNSSGEAEGSCTGSLLTGGLYILTAAHCITDRNGNFQNLKTKALFQLTDNTYISNVASDGYFVFPGWRGGSTIHGDDLAILKLASPAPLGIQQYGIYRNTDEVNQIFTAVGYGLTGTGNTGVTEDDGLKHFGQNRFDTLGDILGSRAIPGSLLALDFDNGKAENDAFGVHLGLHDTGLGIQEVSFATGDSGAPSFIGNSIAGVTSFGISDAVVSENGQVLPTLTDGKIADIKPGRNPFDLEPANSSFGEFLFVTRVSKYSSYIDDVIAGKVAPTKPVPEPFSLLGIIAFSLWSARSLRKTKNQR